MKYEFPDYVYVVCFRGEDERGLLLGTRTPAVLDVVTTLDRAKERAAAYFETMPHLGLPIEIAWAEEYRDGNSCWIAQPSPQPNIELWILLRRVRE